MAYDFTTTSAQVNFGDVSAFELDTVTISAWFYATSLASYSSIFQKEGYWGFGVGNNGDVKFTGPTMWYYRSNGLVYRMEREVVPSTYEWHHVFGTISSGNISSVYLDGGTNGGGELMWFPANRSTTGDARLGGSSYRGAIAEVGIWNVVLTSDERLCLELGVAPIFIRPQSLVAYFPMLGTYNDVWKNGYTGTATDVSVFSHHVPKIILPTSPMLGKMAAGGAGGSTYNESLTLSAASSDSCAAILSASTLLALSGDSVFSSNAQNVLAGALSLSGVSAVDLAGAVDLSGVVSLAGDSSLDVANVLEALATLAIEGDSTAATSAQLELLASLSLASSSQIVSGNLMQLLASLGLVGDAGVTPTGQLVIEALTFLSSAAAAATEAFISGTPQTYNETVALVADAQLAASAASIVAAVLGVDAVSAFNASCNLAIQGQASLDAAAAVVSSNVASLSAQLSAAVIAEVQASGNLQLSAPVVLDAVADLLAAASIGNAPIYKVLRVTSASLRTAAASGSGIRNSGVSGSSLG